MQNQRKKKKLQKIIKQNKSQNMPISQYSTAYVYFQTEILTDIHGFQAPKKWSKWFTYNGLH